MATIEQKRAQQRERAILRIMNTCVHFTGIQHNTCEAGINYHEQFGASRGCFAKIPCTHEGEIGIKECPQVKYPNRDQAEVEELSREAHSKRAMQAVRAAHADSKAKGYGEGHGGQDSLKCPLCPEGTIRYSVASVNGYMHAACTTPSCISWME